MKGLNIPNNPSTKYPIGDLSHLFKLTTLFQLEEKGLLNLSDSINKFLPDYPDGRIITIEKIIQSPLLNPKEMDMVLENVISKTVKMPTEDYLKMSLLASNLMSDTEKKQDGEYYSTTGDLYLWNRSVTNSGMFNKLLQQGIVSSGYGLRINNIQNKSYAFQCSYVSSGGGVIFNCINEKLLIVLLSDNPGNDLEKLAIDLAQIAVTR